MAVPPAIDSSMFLFHMCSRAIAIIANNSGMPWLPDVRRTPLSEYTTSRPVMAYGRTVPR